MDPIAEVSVDLAYEFRVAKFSVPASYPPCAIPKVVEIGAVQTGKERLREISRDEDNAGVVHRAVDETTAHHEHQAALNEIAPDKNLCGAHGHVSVKARRAAHIAGMHDNMIKNHKPVQIERPWERCRKNCGRADAGLKGCVERPGERAWITHILRHVSRSSFAS